MSIFNELQDKIQRMLKEGREDEIYVKEILEKEGMIVSFAEEKEDMYQHIDLWVEHKGNMKGIGIDVKGRKKDRQKDNKFNDNIHWIERQNVNGRNGWLYGSAKSIAFRTNDYVIFVPRKRLIDLVETKTDLTSYVIDCPKECYVQYKRQKWGRDDLSLKVPTKDLIEIASSIYYINNNVFKHIR